MSNDNKFKAFIQKNTQSELKQPTSEWQNIQQRLSSEKTMLPVWGWTSVATTIVIIVSLGIFYRHQQQQQQQQALRDAQIAEFLLDSSDYLDTPDTVNEDGFYALLDK